MVVASVFAFAVLSTGLVSTEKSKETVLAAHEEAAATMVLRGSVIGYEDTSGFFPDTIEKVTFQVGTSVGGGSVDLTNSDPTSAVVVTYLDEDQVVNLGSTDVDITWQSGSGPLLDPGERVEFDINLAGLSPLLGISQEFTIRVKPSAGAMLVVNRTTPVELTPVVNLR